MNTNTIQTNLCSHARNISMITAQTVDKIDNAQQSMPTYCSYRTYVFKKNSTKKYREPIETFKVTIEGGSVFVTIED